MRKGRREGGRERESELDSNQAIKMETSESDLSQFQGTASPVHPYPDRTPHSGRKPVVKGLKLQ